MSADTLSDVLRVVRLTGAVFFDVHARAPWVAEAPAACDVAAHVLPGLEHVIEFHVVTEGRCFGGLVGGEANLLEAGDVIVFPQGDPHVMASKPGLRAKPDVANHRRRVGVPLPFRLHLGPDEGERAHIVCGFLGCDATPFNPLLSALPRVLVARGADLGGGALASFVRLAVAESERPRPGSETVLARLSELLFVEVVRDHLTRLPDASAGWLAGLRDEVVGRALAHLHERPEHPWTLPMLSRRVGVSRTVLAERFTRFVGRPPMQYLVEWRMQVAASLLTNTTESNAGIASRVGYGSEAAFSRAFKRAVGMPPSTYRRRVLDAQPSAAPSPKRGR